MKQGKFDMRPSPRLLTVDEMKRWMQELDEEILKEQERRERSRLA